MYTGSEFGTLESTLIEDVRSSRNVGCCDIDGIDGDDEAAAFVLSQYERLLKCIEWDAVNGNEDLCFGDGCTDDLAELYDYALSEGLTAVLDRIPYARAMSEERFTRRVFWPEFDRLFAVEPIRMRRQIKRYADLNEKERNTFRSDMFELEMDLEYALWMPIDRVVQCCKALQLKAAILKRYNRDCVIH